MERKIQRIERVSPPSPRQEPPLCGGCAPKRACGRSAGGELLCPWRLVVAKSTPLRFRLTAKTAFVPLLLLFPANPLRWALPGITRDWAKRHRGRGRWTLRAHRTAFPGPHYGGRVSVRFCTISGAQKWSGLRDFFRATGPWVCKNCGGCDFTTAPEFTEPTLPVRFSS